MVVLSPQRREGSCPSTRSAVKLSECGRSIERGENEANRGPLCAIASTRRYELRRQDEESELSYGDRPSNDDYFPQGEDFEDEVDMDDRQTTLGRIPKKEPRRFDDNFALLKLEDHGERVGRNALTRFITHAYSPSVTSTMAGHAVSMSKGAFEKEAAEKLQILIEKVSEFKHRIFRSGSDATNTEVRSDKKKEEKASNESNRVHKSINRSDFVDRKIIAAT